MSINSVKEDEEQKDSVKIKVIMRLFGYMLKYKKQIAFVLVCMFIALGISIVNPLLLQRAIAIHIQRAAGGIIRCLHPLFIDQIDHEHVIFRHPVGARNHL